MVNYAIGLAIVGAFLGIMAVLIIKNKKTRKTMGWVGAILLVPVLLTVLLPGTIPALEKEIDFSALSVGGDSSGSNLSVGTGEICAIEDTTVTLAALDALTNAPTGGTHRYKIDGIAKTVADGGTFTASPGDLLDILYMNGSETQSKYFSKPLQVTVPCKGTFVVPDVKLYSNGSVTIQVFNEEGNAVTADGVNESVAAGDVVNLDMNIKGENDKAQIYGGVIVAQFLNTFVDDVIVDLGGVKTSTPQYYTVTNGTYSTKTYTVPPIIGTEKLEGRLIIDIDDTNGPTSVYIYQVNLTYYPNDYYIDEDAGGVYAGPDVIDEDSAQTKAYSATIGINLD